MLKTIKPLLKSVRQYKKTSLITPIFMALEALCECLMPFFMAQLIGAIDIQGIDATTAMQEILKYGAILLGLAICSLSSGAIAGKFAATASCGFASNLRHDLF
jgi:ATP-binding cassette subfamily B protein